VGATRNLVQGNYIGAAPGGGYRFGTGDPGNGADGVRIDDAPDNQIGGGTAGDGNVISSNSGDGVNITGADAAGNTVANNIIRADRQWRIGTRQQTRGGRRHRPPNRDRPGQRHLGQLDRRLDLGPREQTGRS